MCLVCQQHIGREAPLCASDLSTRRIRLRDDSSYKAPLQQGVVGWYCPSVPVDGFQSITPPPCSPYLACPFLQLVRVSVCALAAEPHVGCSRQRAALADCIRICGDAPRRDSPHMAVTANKCRRGGSVYLSV